MKKSERSVASHKVKTAHLKEVLCSIFCRVYLLFTFVTLTVAPSPSLVALSLLSAPQNLHAEEINTLSHQPLNMVDLSLHTKIQRCATFRACVCVRHTLKMMNIHVSGADTNIVRPTCMPCLKLMWWHLEPNNNNFHTEMKPFESNATEHVRVFSMGILNIHVYTRALSFSLTIRYLSALRLSLPVCMSLM